MEPMFKIEPITAVIVCLPCGIGFPSLRAVETHISKKHSKSSAALQKESIMDTLKEDLKKASDIPHPLRSVYLSAPCNISIESNNSMRSLKSLNFLPVFKGYQCTKCKKCFKVLRNVPEHGSRDHNLEGELFRKEVLCRGTINIQTIFGGTKLRYFPVEIELPPIAIASEPDGIVVNGSRLCSTGQNSVCRTNNTVVMKGQGHQANDREGTLNNEPVIGSENIMHRVKSLLCSAGHEGIYEAGQNGELGSDLLAKLNFDIILTETDISMLRAHELCAAPRSDMAHEKIVGRDCAEYLRRSVKYRNDLAPSVFRKICIRNDGQFLCTTEKTLAAYSKELCIYVCFAMRYVEIEKKEMSTFGPTLENYRRKCLEVDTPSEHISQKKRLDYLHDALVLLLLQRLKMYEPTKKLFVKTFIACRSVIIPSHDPSQSIPARFCEAEELSPILASLQYSTTVVAMTDIWNLSHTPNCSEQSMKNAHQRDQLYDGNIPNYGISYSQEELEKDQRVTWVYMCLDTEQNTTASFIRITLNVCMSLMRQHVAAPSFLECYHHPYCGFVDGRELSLQKVGLSMKHWHEKMERLLNEEILFGLDLSMEFRNYIRSLKDNITCKHPGYSFIVHRDNTAWVSKMIERVNGHFERSPKARLELGNCNQSEFVDLQCKDTASLMKIGSLTIRRSRAELWLKKCQQMQETLLACLHVSGGSPARGTEIAAYNLQNTGVGMRNVYICQGEIVLVARYSKMRNRMGGDKPTARFPDLRTSLLMIMYLVLVRPIEAAVVAELTQDETKGLQHWSALFVSRGQRLSDEQIRNVVKGQFASVGIEYSFQQYRQYTSAMVRLITQTNNVASVAIMEECQRIGHEQAGHSVETADKIYGRSNCDHDGIGYTELCKYRSWCRLWQKHLGLCETAIQPHETNSIANLSATTLRARSGTSSHHEVTLREIGETVKDLIVSESNFVKALADKISQTINQSQERSKCQCWSIHETGNFKNDEIKLKRPILDVNEENGLVEIPLKKMRRHSADVGKPTRFNITQGQNPYNLSRTISLQKEKSLETIYCPSNFSIVQSVTVLQPTPKVCGDDCNELLLALRRMLKDVNATFKSQMQADVAAAVREDSMDAVVVMPTGAGKTICFLLPVFMDGNRGTTIVLVPLVALRNELEMRCQEFGLSVGTWANKEQIFRGDMDPPQIYLLAVEHVNMADFHFLVTFLHSSGHLRRIIVDEAHLSISWSEFRPCFGQLQYVLRSLRCPVPRFLFSSTIPPNETEAVIQAHGLNIAMIYRMSALRKNLRIQVAYAEAVRFEKVITKMCHGVLNALRQVHAKYKKELKQGFRVILYAQVIRYLYLLWEFLGKDEVVNLLRIQEVLLYHGRMEEIESNTAHRKWNAELKEGMRIIICTSAFGTGIDGKNIRAVIHFGGSNSIIEYAQEIGRAGRDGFEADCILVYNRLFAKRLLTNTGDTTQKCNVGRSSNSESPTRASGAVEYTKERFILKNSKYAEFVSWAENSKNCRKNALYACLDASPPGLCLFDASSVNCDVCERRFESKSFSTFDACGTSKKNWGQLRPVAASTRRMPNLAQARTAETREGFKPKRDEMNKSHRGPTKSSTCFINEQINSLVSRDHEKLVTAFREIAKQLAGACPYCIVLQSEIVFHNVCPYGRFCGNCGSKRHFRSACPGTRLYERKCFKCGIGIVFGKSVHEAGFGQPACPFGLLQQLCVQLWFSRWREDKVFKAVMGKVDRTMLLNIPKSSRERSIPNFFSWLNAEPKGLPNRMRVVLLWAFVSGATALKTEELQWLVKYITTEEVVQL